MMQGKRLLAVMGALGLIALCACAQGKNPAAPAEESFSIVFFIQTKEPVQGIHVEYLLGETPCGGGTVQNADGSPIAVGDTVSWGFIPDDFPEGGALTEFTFYCAVILPDETEIPAEGIIRISAEFGRSYSVTLSGSATAGYALALE